MNATEKLQNTFNSAKNDITDCWENPLKSDDRITRNWIYAVDPETMAFAKAVFEVLMNGDQSLYTTFVMIMESNNIPEIVNKNS